MKVKCLVQGCERRVFLNGECFFHCKEKSVKEYKQELKKVNAKILEFKRQKMNEFYSSNQKYVDIWRAKSEWEAWCKKLDEEEKRNGNDERKSGYDKVHSKGGRHSRVERFRQTRELLF